MQPTAVIKLNNFAFAYGSKPVFTGISLHIAQGTVHGILGANGVGKSTLFNSIFNHHQHPAIDVADGYEKELAYLQAEPYFYPYMTGMEYLKIVAPQDKHTTISAWNEIFQLPLGEYVHNYSTGMKKKAALLGNVLLNKKIMLLDEPTNGLDLETNEFFKILISRLRERGTTIIISSHILEVLFNTCDSITLISSADTANTYHKQDYEQLRLTVQSDYAHNKQAMLNELLPMG